MRKSKIIKLIKDMIYDTLYELKSGDWNEEIRNNTEDKKYWLGFRYGMNTALIDNMYPLLMKLQGVDEIDFLDIDDIIQRLECTKERDDL